jgi:hypothetical protein
MVTLGNLSKSMGGEIKAVTREEMKNQKPKNELKRRILRSFPFTFFRH